MIKLNKTEDTDAWTQWWWYTDTPQEVQGMVNFCVHHGWFTQPSLSNLDVIDEQPFGIVFVRSYQGRGGRACGVVSFFHRKAEAMLFEQHCKLAGYTII